MFYGEKKSSVAEEMNDKEKVALLAKNTQGELVTVYGFSTHKWYDCKNQNYNMRKIYERKPLQWKGSCIEHRTFSLKTQIAQTFVRVVFNIILKRWKK